MIFGLETGFIEYLQVVTTSNCNTNANLNTLKITRIHDNSSQTSVTSRFPVTDLKNGGSSASVPDYTD
jgi:hypothetical protein